MKPYRYLYLATQKTKGMVKITMALLQCTTGPDSVQYTVESICDVYVQ